MFVNMPGAVIYVIKTRAETKILKEKTKWESPSFKGFHAQLDCELTYGNKNRIVYKVLCSKQSRTKQE